MLRSLLQQCLPHVERVPTTLRTSLTASSSRITSVRHYQTGGGNFTDTFNDIVPPKKETLKVFTGLEGRTPEDIWKDNSVTFRQRLYGTRPNDTYTGRMVVVRNGNIGAAVRQLDSILQNNKVKATVRYQMRHEKPGVKRRRLSSQRWRRLFANEVRKNVQLVSKIRKRGA